MTASPHLVAANHSVPARNTWPTAEQILLLHAALDEEPEQALDAWKQWRRSTDFENLDYGSHRLLPLLHSNLVRHGAQPHPWLGRMKGLHRHSWVRNQRLLAGAAGLITALRGEMGVEVLLLKGAALALQYYPDAGLRPMDDVDFLVPRADAPGCMDLLERHGWRAWQMWAHTGRPIRAMTPYWRTYTHSQDFIAGDMEPAGKALGVDVHWRALGDSGTSTELNEALWTKATAVRLPDGTPTLAPSPTDLLCQVCLHGLRPNLIPPVRWAADATILIRNAATGGDNAGIDWERLHRFAADHAFTLRLGAALDFLAQTLRVPVPQETRGRLRSHRVTREEEKEFRMLVDGALPMEIGLGARTMYRLHCLRSRESGWRHAAHYLCGKWNAVSPAHLPLSAASRGVRRLTRLAAWKLGYRATGNSRRNAAPVHSAPRAIRE